MICDEITRSHRGYRWSLVFTMATSLFLFATLLIGCASYKVVPNNNAGFDIVPPRSWSSRDVSIAYERPFTSTVASPCSIHQEPFHLEVVSAANQGSGSIEPRLRVWVERFPADLPESESCGKTFDPEIEDWVCKFREFEKLLYAEEGRCLEPGEARRVVSRVGMLFRSPLKYQPRFAQGFRQYSGKSNFAFSVDVVPGMRLCWLPAPPVRNKSAGSITYYLAQSEVCILVGTRNNPSGHRLTFEPFLAQQAKLGSPPTIQTEDFSRFGSPIDLQKSSYSSARLVLPKAYAMAKTHPIVDFRQQPFMLAADSFDVLETAVKKCIDPGKGTSPSAGCLGDARLFTPAYRALWVPYIEVVLQERREWVSLGTTVRDVVDRDGFLSGRELKSAVRLKRRVGTKQYRVHFPPDLGAFDLPLIAGDDLRW
jgi:hypothetical protein